MADLLVNLSVDSREPLQWFRKRIEYIPFGVNTRASNSLQLKGDLAEHTLRTFSQDLDNLLLQVWADISGK